MGAIIVVMIVIRSNNNHKKMEKKREKKKIAIKNNEFDIGRIIPTVKGDESYDFKISFLDYEFDIYAIPLFEKPIEIKFGKEGIREITYHKSKMGKGPIVAIKRINYIDGKVYQNLPFEKLLEPTYMTEFPIPLCKILIPEKNNYKKYKPKEEHIELDVGNQNVIELYLTNKIFNLETFHEKWPNIDSALFFHAFEFFATNDLSYTEEKMKYFFSKEKKPRLARESFPITENMNVLFNIYKDELFFDKGKKITITFIENQQFFPLLGHTPFREKNDNGLLEKKKISWEMDIENADVFTIKEKEKWGYWFEKWRKQLEREIHKRRRR